MIAQVFELCAGGHHTAYVSYILPELVRLLDAGHLSRVILTTTTWHRDSPAFNDVVSEFESKVNFDIVPAGDVYGNGGLITRILFDSIQRNRPDFIVSTSAGYGALTLALQCMYRSDFRSREISSAGVIHHGFYDGAHGVRNRLRDVAHRFSWRFAPWSELHTVNPMLYEYMRSQGSWTEGRVRLLPHPVEMPRSVTKRNARELLQIPIDGTYLGQIGGSDARKAIPELLAAFRAARLAPDQRLLLAGNLYPPYRDLVRREYADLVRQERLILLDRYLHPDEFHLANFAVDIAAVAQHSHALSSNLLAAIAAGRPVLADRHGYTGMIIEKFRAGYASDVRDHASLTATIAVAMEQSESFKFGVGQKRLLEFHDPRNFAHSLLQHFYARLEVPKPSIKTWDWAIRGDLNLSQTSGASAR